MNIERTTSKGNAVTIIEDRGMYIHPCAKHEPKYRDAGGRVMGPIESAVRHNEREHSGRCTTQKAVAQLWADELVEMMERAGQ